MSELPVTPFKAAVVELQTLARRAFCGGLPAWRCSTHISDVDLPRHICADVALPLVPAVAAAATRAAAAFEDVWSQRHGENLSWWRGLDGSKSLWNLANRVVEEYAMQSDMKSELRARNRKADTPDAPDGDLAASLAWLKALWEPCGRLRCFTWGLVTAKLAICCPPDVWHVLQPPAASAGDMLQWAATWYRSAAVQAIVAWAVCRQGRSCVLELARRIPVERLVAADACALADIADITLDDMDVMRAGGSRRALWMFVHGNTWDGARRAVAAGFLTSARWSVLLGEPADAKGEEFATRVVQLQDAVQCAAWRRRHCAVILYVRQRRLVRAARGKRFG